MVVATAKKGGDPEENTRVLSFAAWKLAALEWNINRQEKAMEICQEAIDRSIQAESFRGLLPLLKQRLFFEKKLNAVKKNGMNRKRR